MTKVQAQVFNETKRYFICPNCGEKEGKNGNYQNRYDHLLDLVIKHGEYPFGPWSCWKCGCEYTGIVKGPENVELKINRLRHDYPIWVLLKLYEPLKNGNEVYTVIEDTRYDHGGFFKDDRTDDEKDEYTYNEHQCPWNLFRHIFIEEGNTDPHGIFQWVQTIPKPKDKDDPGDCSFEELCDVFSELARTVKTIEGSVATVMQLGKRCP